MASKYRAIFKICFDAATCSKTTNGTDGQLTIIKPRQQRWTVIQDVLLSRGARSDESLPEVISDCGGEAAF